MMSTPTTDIDRSTHRATGAQRVPPARTVDRKLDSAITPGEIELLRRPRRLRRHPALRAMVRETFLQPTDFVFPLFVTHGQGVRKPIPSMPGIAQLSVDQLAGEVQEVSALGIPAVLLFGLPAQKDPVGVENFSPDGIVQQAIRAIKEQAPDLMVITDVCLCEYTDHGHCGVLDSPVSEQPRPMGPRLDRDGDGANSVRSDPAYSHLEEGYIPVHEQLGVLDVLNDETLPILADVAVSHAQAGADIVAPSGMMDGMVGAIRRALDAAQFTHIPIMSYAVKYASSYYGPFRDAADGAPKFGDRKTHQMDPANVREALREAALDVDEGADFLMVKPGLAYLDVVRALRDVYPELPMVAYNVSGEYAMVKAAAQMGWLDERAIVLETLTAFKRAGADLIITYHAKEASQYLQG